MRTSVDPQDPGHKNFSPGKWDIYLDGKLVRYCITADEEEGFVLFHAADETGKILIDKAINETIKQTSRGKVQIVEHGYGL